MMVPDYREIRPQGSPHIPHSPNYYFAERPRYAGYMGPDIGRTQRQHFQGDRHQQSPLPHPHFHGDHRQRRPLPHHRPFRLPHSHDIQREIEKELIRQEIIMSEIGRRRKLEAEVRRELTMERERELALRRGNSGFPFGSSSLIGLPLVETRVEGRSLDERIILSGAERDRLRGRCESAGTEPFPFHRGIGSADVTTSEAGFKPFRFQRGSADVRILEGGCEPLPFQRGSVDARISGVKPVLERGKQKEKIILLAKPHENISGVKRQASGVNAGEFPLDGNLRKKAKVY